LMKLCLICKKAEVSEVNREYRPNADVVLYRCEIGHEYRLVWDQEGCHVEGC
jgi:hypothetical protein